MTKEEDKKQGVVDRGKIRKKKNFDSVIEPIKNEDKNKRRKTYIFLGTPREFTNARGVYIYKRRGSKCTRNITASTPRLSLVLVLLRR